MTCKKLWQGMAGDGMTFEFLPYERRTKSKRKPGAGMVVSRARSPGEARTTV